MSDVKPSPELDAITRRFMRAMFSGEGRDAANLLSTQNPLVFCGSAYDEIWEDQFLRDNYAGHVNEFPQTEILDEEVRAFEADNTGWSLWTGRVHLNPIDSAIEAHLSLVFAMEGGLWRVKMIHNSVAISNVDVLGYEHTSIPSLLEALETEQDELALNQREGLASVMFTDISNSSTLATTLGDRRWSQIVNMHFTTLSQLVESHDGQFVKSLGDGTMSLFSSARQALSAAQAIQKALAESAKEPNLSVRIGLHTGDVVQSEDDFFGSVVNLAARITAAADPGTILVSDVTRAMVGTTPDFSFFAQAPMPLKGFDGAHQTHVLDWHA